MTVVPTIRGPRYVYVTDGRTAPDVARFAWRLDAANHRPLGRGVGIHSSLEHCRRWLEDLHADHDRVVGAVAFDAVRGVWTWRVTRDGEIVAVSVRTYARRFDCRRSAAYFVQGVRDSDPDSGALRVIRPVALNRYLGSAEPDDAAAAS